MVKLVLFNNTVNLIKIKSDIRLHPNYVYYVLKMGYYLASYQSCISRDAETPIIDF